MSEERQKPGDLYVEGLKAIAQREGVSIEEAAKIAEQDLIRVKGLEHIKPLKDALSWLTDGQKDS